MNAAINPALVSRIVSSIPERTARMLTGTAFNLDGARAWLTERLERDESVVFLALVDGVPAGFTQLYPIFSSTTMRRAWLLNDLFVAPTARRAGVGRALLERAHAFGQETRAKELMLQTAVDNLTAQRLYESLGWQRDNEYYVYMLAV